MTKVACTAAVAEILAAVATETGLTQVDIMSTSPSQTVLDARRIIARRARDAGISRASVAATLGLGKLTVLRLQNPQRNPRLGRPEGSLNKVTPKTAALAGALGKIVGERRAYLGLTRQELAGLSGLTGNAVSWVEGGALRSVGTVWTLEVIAGALGMRGSELLAMAEVGAGIGKPRAPRAPKAPKANRQRRACSWCRAYDHDARFHERAQPGKFLQPQRVTAIAVEANVYRRTVMRVLSGAPTWPSCRKRVEAALRAAGIELPAPTEEQKETPCT